jgi:hypothetical protein
LRGGQGLHARIPAPWPRCNKPWLTSLGKKWCYG